jgi:membrane-associated phospholipid phosphatase
MRLNKILQKKYGHFFLLIVFVFLILWFEYLKKTVVPKHIMYSSFDSSIPFIKEFILAYFFWFAYMAIGFIYFGLVSRKEFYRLLIFITFSMCTGYIIFMLYPNGQFTRPVVTGDDIFSKMVIFLYSICETNNVFPSLHVSNAIGVHLSVVYSDKFKNKSLIKTVSFILLILICASTVFVKQHSIIDVLGGVVLAVVIYLIVYHVPKLFVQKNYIYNKNKEL